MSLHTLGRYKALTKTQRQIFQQMIYPYRAELAKHVRMDGSYRVAEAHNEAANIILDAIEGKEKINDTRSEQ